MVVVVVVVDDDDVLTLECTDSGDSGAAGARVAVARFRWASVRGDGGGRGGPPPRGSLLLRLR